MLGRQMLEEAVDFASGVRGHDQRLGESTNSVASEEASVVDYDFFHDCYSITDISKITDCAKGAVMAMPAELFNSDSSFVQHVVVMVQSLPPQARAYFPELHSKTAGNNYIKYISDDAEVFQRHVSRIMDEPDSSTQLKVIYAICLTHEATAREAYQWHTTVRPTSPAGAQAPEPSHLACLSFVLYVFNLLFAFFMLECFLVNLS